MAYICVLNIGGGGMQRSLLIEYAFCVLNAKKLFAGHNPDNSKSRKLLEKLGFTYIGDEYYEPTGLYHPSYELELHPDRK